MHKREQLLATTRLKAGRTGPSVWVSAVEGFEKTLQDRVEILAIHAALMVVVANGASGTCGRAKAAEAVVQGVSTRLLSLTGGGSGL